MQLLEMLPVLPDQEVVKLITRQVWLPKEGSNGGSADGTGSWIVGVEVLGARGMAEMFKVDIRRDPGMSPLGLNTSTSCETSYNRRQS